MEKTGRDKKEREGTKRKPSYPFSITVVTDLLDNRISCCSQIPSWVQTSEFFSEVSTIRMRE